MEQIDQTQKEKWKMFKQFMHNELGLTKEDIREWIEDAVKQEITKMLNDSYSHFNIAEIARHEISKKINEDYNIKREIIDNIVCNYKIVPKENK